MKTVIGITGKIGAGKSTIAGLLKDIPDITVYNCDVAVHEMYKDPTIRSDLEMNFGTSNNGDNTDELNMANINHELEPNVQTWFIPSTPKFQNVSSSAIKTIISGTSPDVMVNTIPWMVSDEVYKTTKKAIFK